jgi:hypothetical protein
LFEKRGRVFIDIPSHRLLPFEETEEIFKVPRWVLGCPECKQEFTHTVIDPEYRTPLIDPFAWIGDKPDLPNDGVRLECPNCKKISVYKRYQLTYRAT